MRDQTIGVTINGDPYTVTAGPRLLLVELLRDKLHLTGAKLGCGTGDCGACTVFLR